MRCDIMFLWSVIDSEAVLEKLVIKPEIDRVKYVPGVIMWSVDRSNVTRSGLARLIGTETYAHMTIRNSNTVRKLAELIAS